MKRTITTLLFTIISFIILGLYSNKINYNKPVIRNIELTHKEIDYQSFFNDLKDQEINLDRSKNTIEYKATKELDANLFNEIDFVNYAPNKNKVEFDYQMKYDANENKFNLSISAKTNKGKVIDNWEGTPFLKENKDIDIVFATDNGLVYLSDLEEKGLINNCGWFSRLFRKIAKVAIVVAAVATVVAITVVAAPIVAAAIPALAGGAVALSGGVAASAMATVASVASAVAVSSFAVAATSETIAKTAELIEVISFSITLDKLNSHNKTINFNEYPLTKKTSKAIAKIGLKTIKRNNSKKHIIYLGRIGIYEQASEKDKNNNIIYFSIGKIDWDNLQTKYGKAAMWLINEAFLNYCFNKEINNGWEFRLLTDYRPYLRQRSINEEGFFYSSEINFLKRTFHSFSSNLIGYYYSVNYYGSKFN